LEDDYARKKGKGPGRSPKRGPFPYWGKFLEGLGRNH